MRDTTAVVQPMTDAPPDQDRALNDAEAARTLRRFYDSASVLMGTVEITEDDVIHVSDNNASAAFFGTTPEAMQGRSARELGVPETYVRMWHDAYRQSLTSIGPVRFDYEHVGKGWLSVTVNHIGPGRRRERFLYVVVDISDRVRGEASLLEAQEKLKGRVAAQARQVRNLASSLALAEQRERSRISQLLHDELQQQLFALQLMLNNMLKDATPAKPDELAAALELTTTSMVTTRTLISELSSVTLHEGDLAGALAWLAGHMESRHRLTVSLQLGEGLPQVPGGLAVLLFQCVQELLFNVVKHAQARSAAVTVRYAQGLQLEVKDDGVGFDTSATPGPSPRERFGLKSVEHRLEAFGGEVNVASAPGDGTRVAIRVPLD